MMKLRTVLAIVTLTTAAAGCVPAKPYTTTGQADWTSPLDADLRIAAAHLADGLATEGYPGVHVLWAGARGHEYTNLSRPDRRAGQQVRAGRVRVPARRRQVLPRQRLLDARQRPDGRALERRRGALRRAAHPRVRAAERRIRRSPRILCDAVAEAKGGVHEPFTP